VNESGWDPEQELVCVCHEVRRATIRHLALRYGSFDEIVRRSEICQTCQGCESEIRAILAEARGPR
jgi:bacterioferritin-associated ferredoxin